MNDVRVMFRYRNRSSHGNLRAMNSHLYQFIHPWHWLTYGQNAAGMGLLGLFFYTLYTRRMMVIAQETRRASLFPLLVIRANAPLDQKRDIVVENTGGSALNIMVWNQPVSARFTLNHVFRAR
jgi:hypothetical protein